jgi:hypothetical protein
MNENTSDRSPSATEELLAQFESLATAEKMEVLWDVVSWVSKDLSKFNDPVLERERDILDRICCNIDQHLEELKAIYGVG